MRIEAYDYGKIKNPKGYKQTENYKILSEFAQSDAQCVKVTGWNHKAACTCAYGLNSSMKRFNIGGMRAISRNGEVFLIKESVEK